MTDEKKVFIDTQLVQQRNTSKFHWIVRVFVNGKLEDMTGPMHVSDEALRWRNRQSSRWCGQKGVVEVKSNEFPQPFTRLHGAREPQS